MTYFIPTRDQAHAGLRAMKTVLTVAAPLTAPRREVLTAAQKYLLHTDFDIDTLAPISAAETAAAVDDVRLRKQFVSALVTLVLTCDTVEPREVAAVDVLAAELGVAPAELAQLHHLAEERMMLLRFDLVRRGLAGAGVKRLYEEGGVLGVMANLASFAGVIENTEVANRYRALEAAAPGTLGHELFQFYRKNGFQFPGEKHGAPEALLPHDLSHILAGYGTDLPGEARTLCFQAGYRKSDPFSIIVFLLVLAQHNLRVTAFAEPTSTLIHTPGLIDEMVQAFSRGSRMNIDLTESWDFVSVLHEPVDALRQRYGIAPN